jgi:hypothetical protein
MGVAAQSEGAVEAASEPRPRALIPRHTQDRELIGTDITNLAAVCPGEHGEADPGGCTQPRNCLAAKAQVMREASGPCPSL